MKTDVQIITEEKLQGFVDEHKDYLKSSFEVSPRELVIGIASFKMGWFSALEAYTDYLEEEK